MSIAMPSFGGLTLVSPVGQVPVRSTGLAPRLRSLDGRRIGFIDNFKPNAAPFLAIVERLLTERFPGISTTTVHKNFTSNVLIADELEGKVDAVVNAWGD